MARSASTRVEDDSADVIVVGVGMAGVAAAIEAADAGASVIALDAGTGGGTTLISGGVVYAGGGTVVQREAGVEDSVDNLYAYLRTEVEDAVSDETLRRFCEQSPASIDWLIEHGVRFDPRVCPFKTSYPNNDYYLYYSGSEASGAARKVATPAQRGHRVLGTGTSGRKLMPPLIDSARAKGVDFRPLTRVTGLERDAAGTVVGVTVSTLAEAPARIRRRYSRLADLSAKPGVYAPQLRAPLERMRRKLERKHSVTRTLTARRGVVLCAGGFIANRAMMREYAPAFRGGLALGTVNDDGSGIRMGMEAGGAVEHMDHVSAWRFISPPSVMGAALFVGRAGVRHVDESRYGAALGDAMVHENGGKGWLLADADLVAEAKKQLKTQPMWFQKIQALTMMRMGARRGDDIAKLATAAGIDADALLRTVAEHNEAIEKGVEDPMQKADDVRRPVLRAPFSLFEVSVEPSRSTKVIPDTNPCPMLTLGGLRVDETTGAVLREDGAPVPGLYAAGRTAVGVCSDNYISGLSIADALFSGRRAGATVAGT